MRIHLEIHWKFFSRQASNSGHFEKRTSAFSNDAYITSTYRKVVNKSTIRIEARKKCDFTEFLLHKIVFVLNRSTTLRIRNIKCNNNNYHFIHF